MGRSRCCRALLLAAALLLAPGPARAGDDTACATAIASAERRLAIPRLVLGTIAAVESGRKLGNRVVAWPWSINAEGVGRYYASKAEAIAAVRTLRSAGLRSIDVGCMQINLAAHPLAFQSLEDAFDPAANAEYAARFLQTLYRQTGRLAWAMTSYHSQTPAFAADYARRLLAVWPGAAAFGLRTDPPRAGQRSDAVPAAKRARRSRLTVLSIRGAAWPASGR